MSRCISLIVLLFANTVLAGTLAQFRTVFGDIEVELYDQDKPVTVQNFIRYVQTGRYQNEFAHRLVPGFVIQGGGFTVTNRNMPNWLVNMIASYSQITNEFGVGRQFSNVYGTIAMAKLGGNTNSATSQWFFNLANNTFLDAPDTNNLFVVFGHVVSGTNILNLFNTFQSYNGTQTSNLVANVDPNFNYAFYPNFASFPLLRPSLVDTNFIFMDITLLQVAVKNVAGVGKEISWNSVSNKLNYVEFTTNLPPIWQSLASTNGNGGTMAVIDSASNAPSRFYRVRVGF